MSLKKGRVRVAALTLMVALAGLATGGPAMAATPKTTVVTPKSVVVTPKSVVVTPKTAAGTSTALPGEKPAIPVDFVDQPTSTLPTDVKKHRFRVTYRNESSADTTVAPQLLVESPDAGPFLNPSDIKVERRTETGCWEAVRLGSQTGTLYTDLTTAQRTLHPGQTVTEVYRLAVLNPEAEGTVHPRVALFD